MKARQVYGKPIEYRAQFSLWLGTNHPPIIPAREKAMWKRVWVFPFEVAIPPERQIPNYGEFLAKKHGSAILAWLAEGARMFCADDCRLGAQPEAMTAYRNEWRERDDIVKRWLDEETQPSPAGRERFPDLWDAFQSWCKDNGEEVVLRNYTSQKFHAEMDDHYPRAEKVLKGVGVREGLVLVDPRAPIKIVSGV